jgi:general secretion pathway protein G
MEKKGFTLIEIIVAMAILSILAGVMVPMVYRTWESNEIAITRARMADLKTAIAGAPELYQQGVRSHYGFVGDIGLLPDSLDDLVVDSGSWPNWQGPYLGGGFDANTFKLDAWSTPIIYTEHPVPLIISGEAVAATLRSSGPDRTLGTADDIDENSDLSLQILSKDIWPTARVQGNLHITLTATTAVTPTYYADLRTSYQNGTAPATANTDCIPLNIGTVESGVPKTIIQGFDTSFPETLPVGRSTLRSRLFSDAACTLLLTETSDMAIFVSDGLNELSLNPPPLYYRIN